MPHNFSAHGVVSMFKGISNMIIYFIFLFLSSLLHSLFPPHLCPSFSLLLGIESIALCKSLYQWKAK
jgi:hypothetical protein